MTKTHRRVVVGVAVAAVLAGLVWKGRVPGEMVLRAQGVPVAVTIAWDPPPAGDLAIITSYVVRLDGVVVGTLPMTGTALAAYEVPATIPTAGPHTITVVATSLWGASPPGTLAFTVAVPPGPSGVRVRKTP